MSLEQEAVHFSQAKQEGPTPDYSGFHLFSNIENLQKLKERNAQQDAARYAEVSEQLAELTETHA